MAGIWWLASYPKSGNTWLRAVLATLLSGRPADINAMLRVSLLATNRALFDNALGIESADLTIKQQTNLRPRVYEIWASEAKEPLYCKAHDACRLTPSGKPLFPVAATLGAVYIVRDPRAVAVSYASHRVEAVEKTIAHMEDPDSATSTAIARMPRHLRPHIGPWRNHVESWLSAPFPVHLVRYEDMHSDPYTAFAGVAAFLKLPSDHRRIAAAVEAAAFPRLQAQERAAGFVEKPIQAATFFREGRIDGWRRALTAEQNARIVTANEPVMRRLGYDTALAPLTADLGVA
jgi:aryl sulfotransferase